MPFMQQLGALVALPEIVLAGLALVLLMAGVFRNRESADAATIGAIVRSTVPESGDGHVAATERKVLIAHHDVVIERIEQCAGLGYPDAVVSLGASGLRCGGVHLPTEPFSPPRSR